MMSTPYVYRITHKGTGQYYIGSKYSGWRKNKEVTEMIGIDYYTSSTDKFIVETFTKERIAEWDVKIIYRTRGDEHDANAEAVAHENLFIGMHIDDELCLNKHYQNIYTNRIIYMTPEMTEEHRQNISKNRKGKGNGKTGKKWSKESIAKRTATRKKNGVNHSNRRPITEETRQKMSAAKKGRPALNKGKPSPNKGRKLSPETIAKRNATRTRKKVAYIIKNLSSYIEATK